MVWHEDLESLGHPDVVAVGWLHQGKGFTKGEVSGEFAQALASLLADPWQIGVSPGHHRCEFCRLTGGPGAIVIQNRTLQIGTGILYVPMKSKLFAAPTMIIHYIDAHEYAPPPVYVDAVLRCPPMRSMDYLKTVKPFVPHLEGI